MTREAESRVARTLFDYDPTLMVAISQRQNMFCGTNTEPTFTLLTHYHANETGLSGSYRLSLPCTIARAGRSSAGDPPRWIRMREARRLASLPECRKHDHLGRLHARRTLSRPTVHRFRALLVVASLLVLLEEARPQSKWSALVNRGKRASAPPLPTSGDYAALAAAIL